MQKVRYPVITAVVGIGVNLAVALATVGALGVYGLALGTLVAAIVMAVLLLFFAKRCSPKILDRALFAEIGKSLVAACGMFVAARELRIAIEGAFSGMLGAGMGLLGGLLGGAVVYLLLLWALGSVELRKLLTKNKEKSLKMKR